MLERVNKDGPNMTARLFKWDEKQPAILLGMQGKVA